MKFKQKQIKSQSDDLDQFIIQRNRQIKTQSLYDTQKQFIKKTNSAMDSKKTVKYSQDQHLNSMFQKIIRQSHHLDKSQSEQQIVKPNEDLYEYQPHIIAGEIRNLHKISQKQRIQYGLQDQNQCVVLSICEIYQIILIGKIGLEPIEGINANLYLPRAIHQYINMKKDKKKEAPLPQRLVIGRNKYIILIKRQLMKSQPKNILSYPYLVIDPVNLLYPSLICNWIDCKRRIALVNYIQGQKQINQYLVYGSTCHRLLEWLAQKAISIKQYQTQKQQVLRKLYKSMLYDMYLINKSYKQFQENCRNNLDNIANFFKTHILQGLPLQINKYKKQYLKIQRIVSSQEMFRSKFMGLKGKIDLLLSGQYIDQKQQLKQKVLIPMELKTGKKMSFAHKRQTQIYNMLVRQQYKKPVLGLLYYSDSNNKHFVQECPLSAFEIIVVHRNQIAQNFINLFHYAPKLTLPKFTLNQCEYCEVLNVCETIYKNIQNRQSNTDIEQLPSKLAKRQLNYTPQQLQYMIKWLNLLHLQQSQLKTYNNISTKIGISSFKIPNKQLKQLTKGNKTKIRLQIQHQCKNIQQISIFDEYYKVSMKIRLIINVINFIEGCKICQIIPQVQNKKIKMVVQMNNTQIQFSSGKLSFFYDQQYDLDAQIETFQSTFYATMRNTIVSLVSQQNSYIKDLVINSNRNKNVLEIDSDDDIPLSFGIDNSQYEGMNDDQKLAYQTAFHQEKFCLIEGMPGTGKTQLIIKLILKFHANKKKILITTFTNRSLDNILQRLVQTQKILNDTIIRQGSQYSVSKKLKEFTSKNQTFQVFQDYKNYFSKKKIWFVTLNSLYIHHLPKQFDIVILDEASQCLQPLCLQGLKRAKKFIMIGDYKQLQPIVKSKEAYRQNMQISLFQRLCLKYPQHKVSLKKQYRMNLQIMKLSNNLVYDNRLELANDNIKYKTIKLNTQWNQIVPSSFYDVFSPNKPVVFINYDPLMDAVTKKYVSKEVRIRKVIQTELPAYIFKKFLSLSVLQHQMAIIAAQNSSINIIFNLLKKQHIIQQNNGSILTIDKSQGIDKQIIILLIQRGNEELVQNPRRLNVALTRAKSKLIIIGSKSHLGQMKVWNGTLQKLLREYKIDLNKEMVQSMINSLSTNKQKQITQ